ncbi:MAG: DUF4168 domain-containing protein [Elainellaceae cyanobacterium]
MNRVSYPSISGIWHPVTRFLTVSLLSFMGATLSVSPLISANGDRTPSLTFGQSAAAQTAVTDDDLGRYARAILDIEPIRREALEELSSILETDSPPSVICNNESSYRRMPRDARRVVVDYCNQSREIVEGYELTIRQFNLITEQQRQDSRMRDRIQEELLDIQLPSNR